MKDIGYPEGGCFIPPLKSTVLNNIYIDIYFLIFYFPLYVSVVKGYNI